MELSGQFFIDNGYASARQLDDGTWIGIDITGHLFFFCIMVGLDRSGWDKRYDYEFNDIHVMVTEYTKLKVYDDIPSGWISKRPK